MKMAGSCRCMGESWRLVEIRREILSKALEPEEGGYLYRIRSAN